MVICICVRGPTLARLATAFVLLSIGNPPALRITLARLATVSVLLFIGSTPAYELCVVGNQISGKFVRECGMAKESSLAMRREAEAETLTASAQ